ILERSLTVATHLTSRPTSSGPAYCLTAISRSTIFSSNRDSLSKPSVATAALSSCRAAALRPCASMAATTVRASSTREWYVITTSTPLRARLSAALGQAAAATGDQGHSLRWRVHVHTPLESRYSAPPPRVLGVL